MAEAKSYSFKIDGQSYTAVVREAKDGQYEAHCNGATGYGTTVKDAITDALNESVANL